MASRSSPDWSILTDIAPCLPQSPITSRSSPDREYPYRYRPVLTAESHGELQLVSQQRQRQPGTSLSVVRQSPEHGPADEDHLGAERQRLEHVSASPHAAVHEDGQPASQRLDHRLQRVHGGQTAVQLSAAVVGDDDAAGAVFGGQQGVLGSHDALDEHRQSRDAAQPAEVGPCQRRIIKFTDNVVGDGLLSTHSIFFHSRFIIEVGPPVGIYVAQNNHYPVVLPLVAGRKHRRPTESVAVNVPVHVRVSLERLSHRSFG